MPCGRPRKNFSLKHFGLIFRSLAAVSSLASVDRGTVKGMDRTAAYTREMGIICPFGFFSLVYRIVCFTIGHFPFKRSVLGA